MIAVSQIDIELIILINLTIFLTAIENDDAFVKNIEFGTMQIVKTYPIETEKQKIKQKQKSQNIPTKTCNKNK